MKTYILLLCFLISSQAVRKYSTGHAKFCDSLLHAGGQEYVTKCVGHQPDPNFKPHPRRTTTPKALSTLRKITSEANILKRKGMIKVSDEAAKALQTPTVKPTPTNVTVADKEVKIIIPAILPKNVAQKMNATSVESVNSTGQTRSQVTTSSSPNSQMTSSSSAGNQVKSPSSTSDQVASSSTPSFNVNNGNTTDGVSSNSTDGLHGGVNLNQKVKMTHKAKSTGSSLPSQSTVSTNKSAPSYSSSNVTFESTDRSSDLEKGVKVGFDLSFTN